MTEDEIYQHMNQLIYIQTPGTKEGIQQARIIDYDPKISSPWGKGAIIIEFPNEPNKVQVKYSINQLELSNNGKRKRYKKRRAKIA